MSYIADNPHELSTSTEALAPFWPTDIQHQSLALMRSIVNREAKGTLSAKSAQLLLQRLLPPLEPAKVVQPINLNDIPTPTSAANYRKAMRAIYRAAVDGKCGLDEARKAMILTKTLWRAELETAGLDKDNP